MNTTWYLHSHFVWLKLSYLSIVKTPFRALGGSRLGVFRWTPANVKLLLPPRHSRGVSLFTRTTYPVCAPDRSQYRISNFGVLRQPDAGPSNSRLPRNPGATTRAATSAGEHREHRGRSGRRRLARATRVVWISCDSENARVGNPGESRGT